MIHDWDTHFWMARTPDGWISAEDHSSAEPIFRQATKIRIEPLSLASVQVALETDVLPGYTAFLRTDTNIIVMRGPDADEAPVLYYVLALEKGDWPDPGRACLSDIPLIEGFRAELRIFKDGTGLVDFKSSQNFCYEMERYAGIDTYKFVRR